MVFTNGCFDLLHRRHVEFLHRARGFGASLVVGLNSDESVRRLKGDSRPIIKERDRIVVLEALRSVSGVVVFEEDTPLNLILKLQPEILVKGADWPEEEVVGAVEVRQWGGRYMPIKIIGGESTTDIINRILQRAELR